jgi:hypothetical protein
MQKKKLVRYIYKPNYMMTELTPQKKVKLKKDIQSIIQAKDKTNVEKLAMVNRLVIRVTKEQQIAYRNLAVEQKKPISKIVRNTLDNLVKAKATLKKQTPQQRKDNFVKFQKKLGLIK